MPQPLLTPRTLLEIETEYAVLPPPPGPDHEGWDESWRHLFETYVPAMRRYVGAIVRPVISLPDDAPHDIVSSYLTTCMEKGWLSRHASQIRSFRAYLKTQLYRFTSDWLDHHFAACRSPRRELAAPPPLELLPVEEAADALDDAFLSVAVERALAALAASSEPQAEVLRDLLRGQGEASADLPERMGRTPHQVAVLRHRARQRFAALLATELKGTVSGTTAFVELTERLGRHLP